MPYYSYINKRIAIAFVGAALLGAGCANQQTKQSRIEFDKPMKCDYSSPAAPPCTYQTTPDGQWTVYNLGVGQVDDQTHAVIVLRNASNGAEKRVQIPRGDNIFFSVGLSDDGKTSYVATREIKPNPTQVTVYKIHFDINQYIEVAKWRGGLHDLHTSKNLMLRFNEENSFVELTDLEGTLLKELLKVTVDHLVMSGVISPDGTRVALKSLTRSTKKLETILVTTNSNEVRTLNLPEGFWPRGWLDLNTLIIENNVLATSTFKL